MAKSIIKLYSNMHLIKYLLLINLILSFTLSEGQSKPLKVGDTMPDITIKNIVNYNKTEAKISDFKSKLIILDFWATWCAPCVGMLKVTDSIQRALNNSVQFIPISSESTEKVSTYLMAFNNRNNTHVFSASLGSEISHKLFDISILPRYVWINPKGVIIGISGMNDVTYSKVKSILEGNSPSFSANNTKFREIYDRQEGIFFPEIVNAEQYDELVENGNDRNNLVVSSTLTGYQEGFFTATRMLLGKNKNGISISNATIQRLYISALGYPQWKDRGELMSINRCLWMVKDTSLYHFSEFPDARKENETTVDWFRKNSFCYELQVPKTFSRNRIFELTLQQLNDYFGSLYRIKGSFKNIDTTCYSLVEIEENKGKFKTNGQNGESNNLINNIQMHIQNTPIKTFITSLLHYRQEGLPLINSTGYTGLISLELNCNLRDINEVNKELFKYGLQFKKTTALLDMIVIEDL